MRKSNLTASEAFSEAKDADGDSKVALSAFVCPHPDCGTLAVHYWGTVTSLTIYGGDRNIRGTNGRPKVLMALCQACNKEVVFINGNLAFPEASEAPLPVQDMPSEVLDDFNEARGIVAKSPRGAAAILRLVVQKLLPIIGSTKRDINDGIKELVEKGVINPAIQKALDSVRVIGNEAVHPGELDLRDDIRTTTSLFNLVNFIVEKAISEPREVAAIYANLPAAKLAGITNRDKRADP